MVLVLLDQSRLLDAEDKAIFSLLQHKRCLLLLNKRDLAPGWDGVQLRGVLDVVSGSRFPALSISAKTGENLEQLEQKILELLGIDALEKGEHLLINQLRHQKSLQQAREALFNARRALLEKFSPEFIAADLQQAIRHLGEMIGEVDVEEVLGEIFSRFCIGK